MATHRELAALPLRCRLPTKPWALVEALPSPIALLRIEAGPALEGWRLLLKTLRRVAITWLLPNEWRLLLLLLIMWRLLLMLIVLLRVRVRAAGEAVFMRRPGKPAGHQTTEV